MHQFALHFKAHWKCQPAWKSPCFFLKVSGTMKHTGLDLDWLSSYIKQKSRENKILSCWGEKRTNLEAHKYHDTYDISEKCTVSDPDPDYIIDTNHYNNDLSFPSFDPYKTDLHPPHVDVTMFRMRAHSHTHVHTLIHTPSPVVHLFFTTGSCDLIFASNPLCSTGSKPYLGGAVCMCVGLRACETCRQFCAVSSIPPCSGVQILLPMAVLLTQTHLHGNLWYSLHWPAMKPCVAGFFSLSRSIKCILLSHYLLLKKKKWKPAIKKLPFCSDFCVRAPCAPACSSCKQN